MEKIVKIKKSMLNLIRVNIILPLLLINPNSRGYFFIILRNLNNELRNRVYNVKK